MTLTCQSWKSTEDKQPLDLRHSDLPDYDMIKKYKIMPQNAPEMASPSPAKNTVINITQTWSTDVSGLFIEEPGSDDALRCLPGAVRMELLNLSA